MGTHNVPLHQIGHGKTPGCFTHTIWEPPKVDGRNSWLVTNVSFSPRIYYLIVSTSMPENMGNFRLVYPFVWVGMFFFREICSNLLSWWTRVSYIHFTCRKTLKNGSSNHQNTSIECSITLKSTTGTTCLTILIRLAHSRGPKSMVMSSKAIQILVKLTRECRWWFWRPWIRSLLTETSKWPQLCLGIIFVG